jgi:hypothetical protein
MAVKLSRHATDMLVMAERRSEIRMMCADMLEISWKDALGKRRRAVGLLEDISPSGACLQLESPLPLGAQVSWRSGKQEFTGYVRYCSYREIGYFVGIEFDLRSRWSQKVYRPQHLLDLRSLLTGAKKAG